MLSLFLLCVMCRLYNITQNTVVEIICIILALGLCLAFVYLEPPAASVAYDPQYNSTRFVRSASLSRSFSFSLSCDRARCLSV